MIIERLPVSRWNEIEKALKESRSDEQLPVPSHAIMLGAINGDEIVGVIGAEKVWMVSPLWVQKERRGNGLTLEMVSRLAEHNTEGLREVCVTTSPHVERLVYSLDFYPVEGQVFRRNVR